MATRNDDTLERLVSELERNAGDIVSACAAVPCSVGWLKTWMRDDPKVEAVIKDAIDTGAAVLESAMIKRAVEGVKEPVYYKDQKVGSKRRYSDSLLMFALKARKRDMYGDKTESNVNINVKHLTDDELDSKIEQLASRLGMTLALPSPQIVDAEFVEVKTRVEDLL